MAMIGVIRKILMAMGILQDHLNWIMYQQKEAKMVLDSFLKTTLGQVILF